MVGALETEGLWGGEEGNKGGGGGGGRGWATTGRGGRGWGEGGALLGQRIWEGGQQA